MKRVTIVTAGQRPPRACSLVTFLQEQESHAPRSGANRFDIGSYDAFVTARSDPTNGDISEIDIAWIKIFIVSAEGIRRYNVEFIKSCRVPSKSFRGSSAKNASKRRKRHGSQYRLPVLRRCKRSRRSTLHRTDRADHRRR